MIKLSKISFFYLFFSVNYYSSTFFSPRQASLIIHQRAAKTGKIIFRGKKVGIHIWSWGQKKPYFISLRPPSVFLTSLKRAREKTRYIFIYLHSTVFTGTFSFAYRLKIFSFQLQFSFNIILADNSINISLR